MSNTNEPNLFAPVNPFAKPTPTQKTMTPPASGVPPPPLSPVAMKHSLVQGMQPLVSAAQEGDVNARQQLAAAGVNMQYTDPDAINKQILALPLEALMMLTFGRLGTPKVPDVMMPPRTLPPATKQLALPGGQSQTALPRVPSQQSLAGSRGPMALPPPPPNTSPNLPSNFDVGQSGRFAVQDQTMYPYVTPKGPGYSFTGSPYGGLMGDSTAGLSAQRIPKNPDAKPRVTKAAARNLLDMLDNAKFGSGN